MCDYSLQNVRSRAAKTGDKLVTTKFIVTVTCGFASVGEPGVAVCLLPGTELAFDKEVRHSEILLGVLKKSTHQKTAIFRQINTELTSTHHDALEFPDGQIVLLTRLCEGQHASVLQLPVEPRTAEEANSLEYVPVVA
jgi:hypothetical protein